jgi:hypothetical protein
MGLPLPYTSYYIPAFFIFTTMIAKLSSFAEQFDPKIVEAGKALFDNYAVNNLTKKGDNYYADVKDTKKYQVTVNVEDEFATAVFCTCGPAICPHVIGVFFAVKKRRKIKTEAFDPTCFDPEPYTLLGQRLNDIIYASRAPGSKDGELEELGETVTIEESDMAAFKKMVTKYLVWPNERSHHPILNGAKRLLGKAILKYEEKEYRYVFDVARAVLTEVCRGEEYIMNGNSANECAKAAVEIFNTLCTDHEVPLEMRKEVFERVAFACKKELYSNYHDELFAILTNPELSKELQVLARPELANIALLDGWLSTRAVAAEYELLKKEGNEEELQRLRLANPVQYRQELIQQAYDRKDYATVKQMALEGVEKNDRGVSACRDWLLKIAEMENDKVYIRTYYRDKYFSTVYTEENYEISRANYTTEEWAKQWPDWESRFSRDIMGRLNSFSVDALATIYLREKWADKLLALLQQHCSFSLAQKAEPLLIQTHPDALMAEYREYFIWRSENCTQGERAAELREMMEEVRNTPEGKKMIKELAQHLLQLHPTWKVFGKEIRKLVRLDNK